MADPPVVHLPDRDYNDAAVRRDWRKTGYAVTAAVDGHPLLAECPQCSAGPVHPLEAGPPRPLSEARWRQARDETLEALLAELGCMVHPAGEARALAVARRIFRYGMVVGWDRAVAASGRTPRPEHLPSADAMGDPGHGGST